MSIHLLSPFLYILFVKSFEVIPQCPKSKFMKQCRQIHNTILSILSFVMLVGIVYGTYSVGKFNSFRDLICASYNDNFITWTFARIFLYSKYLEWGDTLFLHLSGKHISMLQYTHHMTTAFLVYVNMREYISPFFFVPMGLNCLVHVPMYWYFAYPRGFMYQFRKNITQIQIVQHVLCVLGSIYTMTFSDCKQNKYGVECAFLLYLMYLFYFALFYLNTYLKYKN